LTIVELGASYDSLDERALEAIEKVLLCEASEADPPWIVLDMSRTTFIGSSFIGILIRTWKRIRDRDGIMALCGVQRLCRETLESTRLLGTLWQAYPTQADAVSAIVKE
jgi:anti-anti-sigma factor